MKYRKSPFPGQTQLSQTIPVTDPDQARAIGYGLERRADIEILAEIRGRLNDLGFDSTLLEITVSDGVVALEGDIDGRPARQQIDQWVRTIVGVKEVCDRLQLLDSEAQVLNSELLRPVFGHLDEASAAKPENERRCGDATG